MEKKDEYRYVYISDRIDNIEFAYPVYARIEQSLIISQNEKKASFKGNYIKEYENVYIGFLPDNQVESFINSLDGSVLYISSADAGKFLSKPEFINGLDGQQALVLEKKGPGHD